MTDYILVTETNQTIFFSTNQGKRSMVCMIVYYQLHD